VVGRMNVGNIAIKIVDLTKYYGNYLAVDHINLEVYEREIFGFLGPNGAGKSTTLLMLITVLRPSEGTAYIYGYDIRKDPDKVRSLVGIAFQDPKLFWIHTPYEILIWHAKVSGYRGYKAREVVKDILTTFDMWESRNKKAFELSGGMRKRVEVAKVFIQKPKIAIFDEPTAQIDVSGKHMIWDMIKGLRDDGSTVILATNELYEADVLSDRIGIIYKGRIVAVGTPKELKDTIPGGDILEVVYDGVLTNGLIDRLRGYSEVSKVEIIDSMIRIYLNKVEELLPRILEDLIKNGVNVKSVNMREPTLDDVFIHYTGSRIKEAV